MRTETLLIYLRSLLPQLIFKWSQDGSNHPRFDEKELLNLKVPEILLEHQEEIFNLVQSSVKNRQQAKKLLEVAKRAVEIAIETDERAAMAYFRSDKPRFVTPEITFTGRGKVGSRNNHRNR
jgi:hypothetical protein